METVSLTLAPPSSVQSWWEEPTAKLRWNSGILEQMHRLHGRNAYGVVIESKEEWRPVPQA